MIRIPQTSLTVRMYNPAKGSKPEQVPPDVDEGAGAGCYGAVPGGSILRSPSSPATNVSDPKLNWVPRGNFTSKLHGAMVFRTDLKRFPLPGVPLSTSCRQILELGLGEARRCKINLKDEYGEL
jgi:hypothetical protein